MNRFVAFSLLVLVAFTSHTYAAVTFKSLPVGKEVESWMKACKAFQKVMPDVEQFFGCPTVEKFTYSDNLTALEVAAAINQKLGLKAIKSTSKKGVQSFFEKFEGDFSGSFDLVREVEESDEDIRFNKNIEKKFDNLSMKFQVLVTKEATAQAAFYDEDATWNGNSDGKPVEAEALIIINVKTKTVGIYRTGYYYNDKI